MHLPSTALVGHPRAAHLADHCASLPLNDDQHPSRIPFRRCRAHSHPRLQTLHPSCLVFHPSPLSALVSPSSAVRCAAMQQASDESG